MTAAPPPRPIALDVVLNPFRSDAASLVDAAVRAEAEGADGVWTFDHVSSLASPTAPGAGAARDVFTVLGAIAARTERVRLGPLVANIHNRHPAQLALALDTLADLAPGRVVCGIGAGAGPGSPFAREDEALGRTPQPAPARRALLAEHIAALRAIGRGHDATGSVATHGLRGVVRHPSPPIVVGGGARRTLELAARVADGVNIVTGLTPGLADTVGQLREIAGERPFEVSVFVADRQARGLAGLDLERLRAAVPPGVDRLTVLVAPPDRH